MHCIRLFSVLTLILMGDGSCRSDLFTGCFLFSEFSVAGGVAPDSVVGPDLPAFCPGRERLEGDRHRHRQVIRADGR